MTNLTTFTFLWVINESKERETEKFEITLKLPYE